MKIQGIVATPVTPFTADNKVDHGGVERLIEFLITNNAADALALPMHCGESVNLSMEERKAVTETAVRAVAGRIPVLVHTSFAATEHVVELSQHAERAGADGVVVVTPYHWRPPAEALLVHFETICSAIGIGVVAYQFPDKFGVGISPSMVEKLLDRCSNFVGLKDAGYRSEYLSEMSGVVSAVADRFSLFSGVEYVVPAMALGAAGCFSPSGQIAPRLVRKLFDACADGDYPKAREYQFQVAQLLKVFRSHYPASFKAASAMLGRDVGGTRLPLLPLSERDLDVLRGVLKRVGVFQDEPHGWVKDSALTGA